MEWPLPDDWTESKRTSETSVWKFEGRQYEMEYAPATVLPNGNPVPVKAFRMLAFTELQTRQTKHFIQFKRRKEPESAWSEPVEEREETWIVLKIPLGQIWPAPDVFVLRYPSTGDNPTPIVFASVNYWMSTTDGVTLEAKRIA
jgi:hypothetical protein